MALDYYGILGLTSDATPDEIRSAYFDAARRLHPDVNPDPASHELFLQVQEVYDRLSNPKTRAEIDAEIDANTLSNPAIALNLRLSRPALQQLDEPQLVYALIELGCTADPGKVKTPEINLALVVDRSTSMQGERLDMVKTNLGHVVRALTPRDTLSMVAFSDRAEVLIPPTPVQQLSKVDRRFFDLQTGGGTEIFHGLKAGIDQLKLAGRPAAVQQLILITDGRTYGDERACLSLAEQARQEGIAISAVGIGHEWNDQLLDQIASISGGSTGFIRTSKDLEIFLSQKLTSFNRVYASNLHLALRPNPHVELRYAFRLEPDLAPLSGSLPVSLGNLQYGRGMVVLFELLVKETPPDQDLLHLMQGWINMDVFERVALKARTLMDVKLPLQSYPVAEPPPSAIVDALSRVTLYRMQEKARAEVLAGDVAGATRRLQYLATHLLARGDQELAHTVLMEAEQIRQSQEFSKDGDKRIKYGTRALLLPPGKETSYDPMSQL